jgi:hypothetical protein
MSASSSPSRAVACVAASGARTASAARMSASTRVSVILHTHVRHEAQTCEDGSPAGLSSKVLRAARGVKSPHRASRKRSGQCPGDPFARQATASATMRRNMDTAPIKLWRYGRAEPSSCGSTAGPALRSESALPAASSRARLHTLRSCDGLPGKMKWMWPSLLHANITFRTETYRISALRHPGSRPDAEPPRASQPEPVLWCTTCVSAPSRPQLRVGHRNQGKHSSALVAGCQETIIYAGE